MADTIMTHTHPLAHTMAARHPGPKATGMVISHPEIIDCCCDKTAVVCHLPWAAGASLTTPRVSVVSRGELKFLLKALLCQAGRKRRRKEKEERRRRAGGEMKKGRWNLLESDNTCVVLSGKGGDCTRASMCAFSVINLSAYIICTVTGSL